jgi:hypothetical protein
MTEKWQGPTHHLIREDAVWHDGRPYVPTLWGRESGNTKWVATWDEFHAAGGRMHFNEDQTEIVLTLPEGSKFSTKFREP